MYQQLPCVLNAPQILICQNLRNNLQHPNEYIRGVTLRQATRGQAACPDWTMGKLCTAVTFCTLDARYLQEWRKVAMPCHHTLLHADHYPVPGSCAASRRRRSWSRWSPPSWPTWSTATRTCGATRCWPSTPSTSCPRWAAESAVRTLRVQPGVWQGELKGHVQRCTQ